MRRDAAIKKRMEFVGKHPSGKDDTDTPGFYEKVIKKFNFTVSEKIAFIVVAHQVHTLPYFLEALAHLGEVAVIIPKGSRSVSSVTTALKSIYGDIVFENMNKKILNDDKEKSREFFESVCRKNKWRNYRFVILDHGGYFAPRMRDILPEFQHKFIGIVEHTWNGELRYEQVLSSQQAFCTPVFSIARTKLKSEEEAAVARSIVDAIQAKVFSAEGINQSLVRLKKITVIGYGHIGKSVALRLKKEVGNAVISIFDVSALAQKKARSDLFRVVDNKQSLLHDSDLIVLATSQPALNKEDFAALKSGVCLVCVTSIDDQVSMDALDDYNRMPGLADDSPVTQYQHTVTGKNIYLAADGGSVNFLIGSTAHPILHAIFASNCVNVFRLIMLGDHEKSMLVDKVHPSSGEDDAAIKACWETVYGPMLVGEPSLSVRVGVTPEFNLSSYVPRETLEIALEEKFSSQKGDGRLRFNYFGESGSGKTHLALYYYYHARYPYVQNFWFNAESSAHLEEAYLELGSKERLFDEAMSRSEKIVAVREWIENQVHVLVVYDNAKTWGSLDIFLPKYRAHVLVTSQTRIVPAHLSSRKVEGLEKNEIINLIRNSGFPMGASSSPEETSAILLEMMRSPIAVQQACVYMQEKQLSLEGYMKVFQQEQNNAPMNSVEVCVKLAISVFDEPTLLLLLNFSLLALTNLPIDFFYKETEAILDFKKRLIININNQFNTIFIHEAFQEVFKEYIAENDLVVDVANAGLRRMYDYVENGFLEFKLLAPHIKAMILYIQENSIEKSVNQRLLAYLYCTLSKAQLTYAYLEESKASLDKSWKVYTSLETFKDVIFEYEYQRALYFYFWETGELSEGLLIVEKNHQLVKEFPDFLGSDRKYSLMANLGAYYNRVGNVKNAEKIYRAILRLLEGQLPRDKKLAKQIAHAFLLLGFVLSEKGQPEEALSCIEKSSTALVEAQIDPSSDNQHTLLFNECLGLAYRVRGDKEKARKHFQMSLLIRIEDSGEKSRLVALTKLNLALAQEKLSAALPYFIDALRIFSSINATSTIVSGYFSKCYLEIGRGLLHFKQPELAQQFLLKSLQLRRRDLSSASYESNDIVALTESLLSGSLSMAIPDLRRHLDEADFLSPPALQESLQRLTEQAIPSMTIFSSPRLTFFTGILVGVGVTCAATYWKSSIEMSL